MFDEAHQLARGRRGLPRDDARQRPGRSTARDRSASACRRRAGSSSWRRNSPAPSSTPRARTAPGRRGVRLKTCAARSGCAGTSERGRALSSSPRWPPCCSRPAPAGIRAGNRGGELSRRTWRACIERAAGGRRTRRASPRSPSPAPCAGSTSRRTRRGWSSRRWTSAIFCASRWRPRPPGSSRPRRWARTTAAFGSPNRRPGTTAERCASAARSTTPPTRGCTFRTRFRSRRGRHPMPEVARTRGRRSRRARRAHVRPRRRCACCR